MTLEYQPRCREPSSHSKRRVHVSLITGLLCPNPEAGLFPDLCQNSGQGLYSCATGSAGWLCSDSGGHLFTQAMKEANTTAMKRRELLYSVEKISLVCRRLQGYIMARHGAARYRAIPVPGCSHALPCPPPRLAAIRKHTRE